MLPEGFLENRVQIEIRGDQADVTVAGENAHHRLRDAVGHEPCLLHRRHQVVLVGGEKERRRPQLRESCSYVVSRQVRRRLT